MTASTDRSRFRTPLGPRGLGLMAVWLMMAAPVFAQPPGTMLQEYFDDQGGGQKVRLWVPDGEQPLRGIIIDLGFPHGADRPDYQAFGRAERFAVLGTLLRWPPTLKADLERIVADMGRKAGHPELANVPWVTRGFSRSVGPAGTIGVRDPEKVLAVLVGGVGYGAGDTPDELAQCRRVAMMNVHGSIDPFLAGPAGVADMRWWKQNWPALRDKRLPWGAAIQWGAGHSPGTGFVMHAAFLRDVLKLRMPAPWDATTTPIKLRDMPSDEQGWLGDVATWDQPLPVVAPAREFNGDRRLAHWLPGSYSAAVWRAYVVRSPTYRLELRDDRFVVAAVPADAEVRFFDGDRSLAVGAELPASEVKGLVCLLARVTTPQAAAVTRPLLVYDGRIVPLGEEPAAPTLHPVQLLEMPEGPRATLRDLYERAAYNGPGEWRLAYRDTLAEGLAPWRPGGPGKRTAGGDEAEVVDGALQLTSTGQFMAQLPYSWPRDLAVEYECRAVGDKPNDMGCMLGATLGGGRPWRDGAMFHFGAAGNTRTYYQVAGEDTGELGPRIAPGQWHRVRWERQGARLQATVDGKPLRPHTLSPQEARGIVGHYVGFYVFSGKAQFRHVKVFVREPKNPADVKPAMPSESERHALAATLLRLLDHRYAEQRNLAGDAIGAHAATLQAALGSVAPEDLGRYGRARLEELLKTARPPRLE